MNVKRKTAVLILAFAMISAAFLAGCGGGSSGSSEASWPAMESLQEMTAGDITSIEYSRSTEGGGTIDSVKDAETIEDIFLRLKDVSIGEKTEEAVEDDGLGLKIVSDDASLTFSFEHDILVLENGDRYKVENLDSLRSYIDKLIEAGQDTSEQSGGTDSTASSGSSDNSGSGVTDTGSTASSGSTGSTGTAGDPGKGASDYDVSKNFWNNATGDGIAYMYFNDFLLVMPDNDKYSFDMDGNSVTFYLFSAQQEGYGGRLVTIKAYDMDDDSYEQLPMEYHVAGVGQNVNKRFVAIYPSDLQYNPNDSQQAADYKELYDHLHKIGEGAANSPFQTSDSD